MEMVGSKIAKILGNLRWNDLGGFNLETLRAVLNYYLSFSNALETLTQLRVIPCFIQNGLSP